MTATKSKANRIVIVSTILLAAILLALFWLKSAHKPAAAINTAQQFVDLLQKQKYEQAYSLVKTPSLVGSDLQAFKKIVQQQLRSCKLNKQTYVFPFQSNGNRLRRLVGGKQVEMPEVTVDFSGSCLFDVTLHYKENNQWQVFKFQSHAG